MKLFLLLLFCHVSSQVKHSLKFLFTVSSGVQNFPEVVALVLVDDVEAAYCDSDTKKVEPKQEWMEKLIEDEPQHLERYTQECVVYEQIFRDQFTAIRQHLNQTGGIHVLQRMSGCEWDDETGEVNGLRWYGYDGEDFLEFDMKTETWIAATPRAVNTKRKWDNNTDNNKFWKNYHTSICPQWLKKYVDYGKRSRLRTELPSVSLLQKTPSSPVSCHSTGFFPDRAVMFWRKDGVELHEDVDHGEILPNNDGSFQMRVDLDLSSVTPEDWEKYECVFQLPDVEDNIITRLDKAVIRTNQVSPSEFPAGAVIGAVVGLLLLALCITGLFIWRRNNDGFRPANSSDSSSSPSVKVAAPI